jgi:hypothetical protein
VPGAREPAPAPARLRTALANPFSGTKKPTPMTQMAPASLPVWLDPLTYCGCGSDRRLLSSCMSTATFASAFACWRPWCAQKSSSPELASSTRTYAWAPQRSQTSSAVSGLVGAIAPVNVAFLRVVPPAFQPSGFSFLPLQLSTTHTQALAFPTPGGVRHKRNHPQAERGPTAAMSHTVPAPHRYAGAVPVAHRHRVYPTRHVPRYPPSIHSSWSVWDFIRSSRVALPGAYGPERYYFR